MIYKVWIKGKRYKIDSLEENSYCSDCCFHNSNFMCQKIQRSSVIPSMHKCTEISGVYRPCSPLEEMLEEVFS